MKAFYDTLRALGFADYRSYLFSKRWQARKAVFASKHPKKCYVCRSKVKVHLHHKTYERLGSERDSDMIWLCKKHHKNVHKSRLPLVEAHVALKRRYLAAKRSWKIKRKRYPRR